MKRIAYVSADPGVPVFGCKGCSVHVQEVIRALCRIGAQVDLYTVRTGGAPPPGLEDVRVFEIPLERFGDAAVRERCVQAVDDQLRTALRQQTTYDMVYERYSLWSTAGMDFAYASQVPGVLEVNAPLVEEQAAHRTLVDREHAERIATHVFRTASLVVTVSKDVATYVRRMGADSSRVHVLPNGVDPWRFVPPRGMYAARPFTVGFVGSLKPWHDLTTLAAAYRILRATHPGARLLVVGDGPERQVLERGLASELAAGDVVLTGAISPQDVPGWLHAMDVGVAPYGGGAESRYFSPLKILEYMAAGLPVLGADVGQVPTLVIDGMSGLLYPPGDASALGRALQGLADQPKMGRAMGCEGRRAVIRSHSWDSVVEATLRWAGSSPTGLESA